MSDHLSAGGYIVSLLQALKELPKEDINGYITDKAVHKIWGKMEKN